MQAPRVPDRPSLEGLEDRWSARWEHDGTYRFDRNHDRADVFSIDTPPPTVSGALHVGHVFSYTQTDIIARFQRMTGKAVFYPIGWDDNGLPTERRVQNYFGVVATRRSLTTPTSRPRPDRRDKSDRSVPISRPNFVELCLTPHRRGRAGLRAAVPRLGALGGLVPALHDDQRGRAARLATGFLRMLERTRPTATRPRRCGTSTSRPRSPRPSSSTGRPGFLPPTPLRARIDGDGPPSRSRRLDPSSCRHASRSSPTPDDERYRTCSAPRS
jgi:hypothetical protein